MCVTKFLKDIKGDASVEFLSCNSLKGICSKPFIVVRLCVIRDGRLW